MIRQPLTRLLVLPCLMLFAASGAAADAGANQSPCVFTADELASAFGKPFRPPEIRVPTPPVTVNCTFEATNERGKKLYLVVKAKETEKEFSVLQRLAGIQSKGKLHELNNIGRAAFTTPDSMRLWDGTRSLSVKGMKEILKRDITPEEAGALLALGLKKMPR